MNFARKAEAGGSRSGAMDFSSWGIPNPTANGWGVTPLQLVAPCALLVMMLVVRRISQPAGPRSDTRDFSSAALILIVIGAAFLWIFAGLGLLARTFH
jgi:hypothetical protein